MSEGWRWESVVSLACVAFLPAWLYGTATDLQPIWLIVMGGVLGLGIGCGIAGMRRGRLASRLIALACLTLLAIVAVGFIVLLWLDPSLFA
jgi:hypothetical protein